MSQNIASISGIHMRQKQGRGVRAELGAYSTPLLGNLAHKVSFSQEDLIFFTNVAILADKIIT